MSNTVIKVEHISKQYRLGDVSTGSFAHDLNRGFHKLRGKGDPYAKVTEANDRTIKGSSDYIWALQDINFEVKQGEVVGIIGKNGAGKSTLLKILSRTTSPTNGTVKIKGKVASLLEVGTGFHPELSGRENIFLNGAILGMSRREIQRKFDEIVDFSGVERYIDTPVKRYSSGMYVRLAFAVAAHLEPDILIVDEVLAVGDAEFQKKAIGKMKDVSNKGGRTVLYVSHNLNSIALLCNKGILIETGQMKSIGEIENVITLYNASDNKNITDLFEIRNENKKVWLSKFEMIEQLNHSSIIETFMPVAIKLGFESVKEYKNVNIGVGLNDLNGVRIFTLFSKSFIKSYSLESGYNEVVCYLDSLPLKPGNYFIEISIASDLELLDYYDYGLQVEIKIPSITRMYFPSSTQGSICLNQKWE